MKQKTVFLIYSKNLPKKHFGGYIFSAFCFGSRNEFESYIKKYFRNLSSLIFKKIIKTFKVPNYTKDGRVFLFETKDKFNKPIIYECNKLGLEYVMMGWEKKYMEKCIDFLSPFGHVLEFGFGLGYSADQILKHNVKSYTVVEKNPVIIEKAIQWAKQNKNHNINIVFSDWRDYVPDRKFNSFFCDTYDWGNKGLLGDFLNNFSEDFSLFGCPCVNPYGPVPVVHTNYNLINSAKFSCYVPSNAIYVTKESKMWLVKYSKQNKNKSLIYYY